MYPSSFRHASFLILATVFFAGCSAIRADRTSTPRGIQVEPYSDYQSDASCTAKVEALRQPPDAETPPSERYQSLPVMDAHYHGAAILIPGAWNKYHIERTDLFWAISEPRARLTDLLTWWAYRLHPDRVYPFFAGVPIYDPEGLAITRNNLEQGFMGIGEIVAASTNSPAASKLEWKSRHPNDGNLPAIYDLAAAYQVPVLLHIDPPFGYPIQMLEQAMAEHPDTLFIFAHANAYNSPQNIESLLSRYPNLWIDFFAGFTAYNPDSANTPADFVPLIEKYPDRFLLSTDGGYGVGYDRAAQAMYELLDLLTPQTACRAAYQNLERMMEEQPPTASQVARIQNLSSLLGEAGTRKLNKRMANELIFELENKAALILVGCILTGIILVISVKAVMLSACPRGARAAKHLF